MNVMRSADVRPDIVLIAAAHHFDRSVADIDRRLRRAQITIPEPAAREEVVTAFWSFVNLAEAAALDGVTDETIRTCREIVGRWLFRSRLWSRAFLKPHGYAGDFRMIEWLYDLESDECADPAQPAIVNCLDGLMKTVHSACSVWERRRWFRDVVTEAYRKRNGALRVLDVAGGGTRYLRDFLETVEPGPRFELTVVDQDGAAIAFCRAQALEAWASRVRFVCAPIRSLAERLVDSDFDLVISAGLFDYLEAGPARELLAHLASLLTAEGTPAISNFHPGDCSRLVKEWARGMAADLPRRGSVCRAFPRAPSRSDQPVLEPGAGLRQWLGGAPKLTRHPQSGGCPANTESTRRERRAVATRLARRGFGRQRPLRLKRSAGFCARHRVAAG
jgi:ubiquinone/menaquinone biosynthesis C-methylase UbiE